jgi:hypothetical protein
MKSITNIFKSNTTNSNEPNIYTLDLNFIKKQSSSPRNSANLTPRTPKDTSPTSLKLSIINSSPRWTKSFFLEGDLSIKNLCDFYAKSYAECNCHQLHLILELGKVFCILCNSLRSDTFEFINYIDKEYKGLITLETILEKMDIYLIYTICKICIMKISSIKVDSFKFYQFGLTEFKLFIPYLNQYKEMCGQVLRGEHSETRSLKKFHLNSEKAGEEYLLYSLSEEDFFSFIFSSNCDLLNLNLVYILNNIFNICEVSGKDFPSPRDIQNVLTSVNK